MAQLRCTNITFCCNGCTTFSVDGANGRLLEVTDDLSNSIFSANTIAGLPVIEAFANNCVTLGQFGGHRLEVTCNSIRGGRCTTASGTDSVVVGGSCNTASASCSFIGSGCRNTASGGYSIVVGGRCNTSSAYNAIIAGGDRNTASGQYSFIGNGFQNRICCNAQYGSILHGFRNCVCGGFYNTISGGYGNRICGTPDYSFIGNGYFNSLSGAYSFIGGGSLNFNNSGFSSIVGGTCNNTNGQCNVHIIGSNIMANTCNFTFVNNLCQTGGGLSDRRIKNTIEPVKFSLNEITQLNPVSFCWNGDSSCHKNYGFIAQEVQQTMSCVVTCNMLHRLGPDGSQVLGNEGEPLLQFEKDAIYASYVNAFKELKAENDALRQRITAIENILKNNNLL